MSEELSAIPKTTNLDVLVRLATDWKIPTIIKGVTPNRIVTASESEDHFAVWREVDDTLTISITSGINGPTVFQFRSNLQGVLNFPEFLAFIDGTNDGSHVFSEVKIKTLSREGFDGQELTRHAASFEKANNCTFVGMTSAGGNTAILAFRKNRGSAFAVPGDSDFIPQTDMEVLMHGSAKRKPADIQEYYYSKDTVDGLTSFSGDLPYVLIQVGSQMTKSKNTIEIWHKIERVVPGAREIIANTVAYVVNWTPLGAEIHETKEHIA